MTDLLLRRPWDLFNVGLISTGFGVVLTLIPPRHEYPIIDDWIYAGSVRDVLATGRFTMPDWAQANLVGLTYWGALWAKLLGFSFTTLTISTLFLGVVGLVAFYGLARSIGVRPAGALFATAMLGLNPLYLHLSYSFMTDVPFLALTFLSCVFYVRGLGDDARPSSLPWLVLAGAAAGWAFLMRQFAVLVPLAFLIHLAARCVAKRRWLVKEILVTALVPGLIVAVWYVWSRQFPQTWASASAGSRSAKFVLKGPWPRVFLLRSFVLLPLTALFTCSALPVKGRRWWLAPVCVVLILAGAHAIESTGEVWIAARHPPFTARLGPVNATLPNQAFSFGAEGNIVTVNALDFVVLGYVQQPVWTMEAWRGIFLLGAALAGGLLAAITWALLDWGRSRPFRRPPEPAAALYLLGGLIFVASVAFPGDLFDRYVLGFLPFLILFVARNSNAWSTLGWTYSVAGLAVVGMFTLLAKADHMEHMNARWTAARWMESRVGGVQVGFDWEHWGGTTSDAYRVGDAPRDGFRTEQTFSYLCRLCGRSPREVFAQSRSDAPPLLRDERR
jgi:4-amino-4-deoxy-L-arabinose transferase-like glycosyltransferase